jgi:PRC-barrel domain
MTDIETIRTWEGRTLIDRDGGRIGTIDAIYLDDRTGRPEWALVNTGLFGTKSSFVPLAQAFQSDIDVVASYDKQLVRDAPRVDPDGHLSEDEERELWLHYGLDYDTTGPTADEEPGRVRLRRFVTTVTGEERVAEVQHENGKRGRHGRRPRR